MDPGDTTGRAGDTACRPGDAACPCGSALSLLSGDAIESLTSDQARQVLAGVARERARLTSLEARVIARLSALNGPAAVAVDLATQGRLGRGEVRSAIERAETLGQFEILAGALAEGSITASHVDALARGMRSLGEEGAGLLAAQQTLVDHARALGADQFGKLVANEVERQSSRRANEDFENLRRATNLKWWNHRSGMVRVSGAFDPERGAVLVGRLDSAVEALFHGASSEVDVAPGVEPNDHRRAVALFEIVGGSAAEAAAGDRAEPGDSADRSLASLAGEAGASARAEIVVTVDLESLRGGSHPGSVRRTSAGGSLPVDVIRRIACEAGIIPAVLDGSGIVVDIGRARRLATRSQRHAIFAMYSTCAMPGCGVNIARCVPHHIEYWERGGRTDLANLVPLCAGHHRAAHEGGWRLALDRDRTLTVTMPDGHEVTRPLIARTMRSRI